jgi:GT2 family glycosyltransferase
LKESRVAWTDQVTILIKTFERPETLQAMVWSIREYCGSVRIHVADDSRDPKPCEGVDLMIPLPFDTGISEGRNVLMRSVKTPYAILADDDFVVERDSRLDRLVDLMETTPFYLIGGSVDDSERLDRLQCFCLRQEGDKLLRWRPDPDLKDADGVIPCSFVRNFFICRPEQILAMGGWPPELKQGEHYAFFVHLLGKIRVGYAPDVYVKHAKGVGGSFYQKHRNRGRSMMRSYLLRTFGIQEIVNRV